MLVEEVTAKKQINHFEISGGVDAVKCLRTVSHPRSRQAPPVPETTVLTEEDVIGLVSTYIQATWEGKGTFVPYNGYSRPSIIFKAREESSARYIGQQVWIVKFSDCGTFLVNDRTGAVASP